MCETKEKREKGCKKKERMRKRGIKEEPKTKKIYVN